MRLLCVRGHHIWPETLTKDSVVLDAGAHRGEFSAEIMRRFACECHLIEANPSLASELDRTGAASVTNAALSGSDGTARLQIAENLESSSLPDGAANPEGETSIEIETISLATFIQRLGREQIDLLKLDIEGAEFEVIATTPDNVLRRIAQLTVEFHDFQPRFRGQHLFENARKRLESVGFVCASMAFRTHGDVLFLNRDKLRISSPTRLYLRFGARLVEKMRSRLSRV